MVELVRSGDVGDVVGQVPPGYAAPRYTLHAEGGRSECDGVTVVRGRPDRALQPRSVQLQIRVVPAPAAGVERECDVLVRCGDPDARIVHQDGVL